MGAPAPAVTLQPPCMSPSISFRHALDDTEANLVLRLGVNDGGPAKAADPERQ